MKRATSTLAAFKRDPRVDDAWDEGDDGYWVSLKRGFVDSESGAHALHEWNARDLLARKRWITKCQCSDCV